VKAALAIADPVRREILAMLRTHPAAAGEIASRFTISRPAVSRHLRILRECGLVHDRMVGRQRLYSLDPSPLREIASWIAQFDVPNIWEQRLDALETEVARTRIQRRRAKPAITIDEEIA
jgi:DNA-binding transcriptional ArsR family regulator